MDKVWWNGQLIYDEFGIGDRNISVFEDKFKNRILGPYSKELFEYYTKELINRYQIIKVNSIKKRVIKRLENCYGLSLMLSDLRKGHIKWEGVELHNAGIAGTLYSTVESLLFEELEEPWVTMMGLREDKDRTQAMGIWEKWSKSLAWLPQKDTIDRDDEGEITEFGMDQTVGLIKACLEDSKSFVGATENSISDEIIKWIAQKGVKMCNASYREIYEVLDFFYLISREQLEYHKKTGSKYARENYIKLKVVRLDLV